MLPAAQLRRPDFDPSAGPGSACPSSVDCLADLESHFLAICQRIVRNAFEYLSQSPIWIAIISAMQIESPAPIRHIDVKVSCINERFSSRLCGGESTEVRVLH